MSFLKKYWAEILTIALISTILIVDCAPSPTWINTDSDGIHYTYSAQYLYPSHKGSAPLYLLFSNLVLRLPIGTEFWRMAMISVFSGIAACIFILLIIRLKLKNRWYAIIGALIYGGSALAISQNTIVEAYPLVVAVCLAVYYSCLKQKWLTAAILIGVAGAIHPTSMLVIIPMLWAYRKNLFTWRRLGVMAIFTLFYLYVPLTNRPPYMWDTPNQTGGIFGFVKDTVLTAGMLSGRLGIMDFPKRVLDVGGMLLLNFAVIGLVPLFYAFKNGKFWYKNVLLWMIAIPVLYYASNLAPQTVVYMQPSIAFGAVAVAIGLSKLSKKWMYAIATFTVILLGFNANYFDIGRTLDKNLSATEYYNVDLAKVPDGQILMSQYGWEWAAIYRYNKEFNRDIIAVSKFTLISTDYQKLLNEDNVKFEDNFNDDRQIREDFIAKSVITLNDNVWTTRSTDPRTYGAEVVKATLDSEMFRRPTEPPAQWHFKPSNPYNLCTGSVEISEWGFVTMTNHTVLLVFLLAFVPIYLFRAIEKMISKKTKRKVYGQVDK